jgi:hypothetical protein
MTTYARHARLQMRNRRISEEHVEAILRRPIGNPEPGSRPDTIVVMGIAPGGRRLKVVVDSVDRDHVVTTYEG